MNRKMVLVLIILIISVLLSAGCFEDKPKKSIAKELVEMNGELNSTIGWLNSGDTTGWDNDKFYRELNAEIPLFLNETSIKSMTIMINFQDYDSAHESSDGNSPEDEVEVSIEGYDASGAGTTPCSITLNIKANVTEDGTVEYLPSELAITVTGKCFCEITYPMIPRPSAFIRYMRDMGVAYDMSVKYSYEDYE